MFESQNIQYSPPRFGASCTCHHYHSKPILDSLRWALNRIFENSALHVISKVLHRLAAPFLSLVLTVCHLMHVYKYINIFRMFYTNKQMYTHI